MSKLEDVGDEMAGVLNVKRRTAVGWTGSQTVTVAAEGAYVRLDMDTSAWPAGLTPHQARFLARKLLYMARLVDQRLGPQEVVQLLRKEAE